MMTTFVRARTFNAERVADKEAAWATETALQLVAESAGTPWSWWLRLRLWIFNVAGVATLGQAFFLVALWVTVFKPVPETARTPERMKCAIFVIDAGDWGVSVSVSVRLTSVSGSVVWSASEKRCDEIVRVPPSSLQNR
jgi:hypothetical protein